MTGAGTVQCAVRAVRSVASVRVVSASRSLVALTIVALVALLGSCSGDDASSTTSTASTSGGDTPGSASTATTEPWISEDEAVAAARRALAAEDPDFDFDVTRVHVSRLGGSYDISFVPTELTGPGGEPHVVIDRATGEVLETYLTR